MELSRARASLYPSAPSAPLRGAEGFLEDLGVAEGSGGPRGAGRRAERGAEGFWEDLGGEKGRRAEGF